MLSMDKYIKYGEINILGGRNKHIGWGEINILVWGEINILVWEKNLSTWI